MLLAGALAVGGCGGGGGGVKAVGPALPVNLTVYINDSRVSLSPDTVGAGQVVFIITNQASRAQALTLLPSGAAGQPIASTGSISPGGIAQMKVGAEELPPGDYSLTSTTAVQPAALHIGPRRPSGSNDLLQP
jgi:hypothetical protein